MSKMVRLPWVNISFTAMVRDMLDQGTITLTIRRRDDVQTKRWYELSWSDSNGLPQTAVGSDMQLVLRRAAEVEQQARMEWGGDDE